MRPGISFAVGDQPGRAEMMAVQGIRRRVLGRERSRISQWIDEEPVRQQWQPRSMCWPRRLLGGRHPILANPESREFIGQAVQDLDLEPEAVSIRPARTPTRPR